MNKKKINSFSQLKDIKFLNLREDKNIDFSCDDDFIYQDLELHFSKKNRAGKIVTIVKGFYGTDEQIKDFEKKLKKKFSVGGSLKGEDIILQGNIREKVFNHLISLGHSVKLVGG